MCSWEPPVGAFLLPRQEEGEWWELADANRGNRSYYYSELNPLLLYEKTTDMTDTLTGVTQWTRPTGNAFVIPLGLIQVSVPFAPTGYYCPSSLPLRLHPIALPPSLLSRTTP
jgi:hypothetical protein